jgi:hypothetical protein
MPEQSALKLGYRMLVGILIIINKNKSINAALCFLIVQASLPAPDGDLAMVMPLCCIMLTTPPLWMWLLQRYIRKRVFHYVDPELIEFETHRPQDIVVEEQPNNERPIARLVKKFFTKSGKILPKSITSTTILGVENLEKNEKEIEVGKDKKVAVIPPINLSPGSVS